MLRVRKMMACMAALGAGACDDASTTYDAGVGAEVDATSDAFGEAASSASIPGSRAAAWVRALPSATDCLSSAAFMDNRYVVVSGAFRGTADFGDGARTSRGGDLFALVLDLAGQRPETRTFASDGQTCGALTLDGDGLLVLAGGFRGTLGFGATSLAANGPEDAYLASVSLDLPAPGVRFARRFGAPSSGGPGVAVLARATTGRDGAITAVGRGSGVLDFGLGLETGSDLEAPLVLRVDKGGTTRYGRRFVGGPARALDVGVDASGAATLVGVAQGPLDFGAAGATGGMGAIAFGAEGGAFVVQIDDAGAPIWVRTRGDGVTRSARAEAVATDLAGTAVVVGEELGPEGARGFVWKLDAHGTTLWELGLDGAPATPDGGAGGTGGDARLLATATDVSGGIFVGGLASSDLLLDGRRLPARGAQDGILIALDPAGRVRWASRIGGAAGRAEVSHLSVTRAGAILVTGSFQGRVDVLGTTLESAARAGFVAKIVE